MIRGVKIGPSPAWLVERLATVGIAAINNVVDITNYVLMECGQPLHAFDLAKLDGRRDHRPPRPRPGETVRGDQPQDVRRSTPAMCVIADAERPVALGGVMGGRRHGGLAGDDATLLIEAAEFDPLSIRNTARQAEPAQRFVVSLRARRRSRRASIGPAAAAAS